MPAISVEGLSKRFSLHQDRPRSLQELVLGRLRRENNGHRQEFWALKEVSFDVEPGEALALIGENGSGKSTLLKLLARILIPTEGTIETQGRVAGLLELGAGFHLDLTGRENIFLNGSILGLSRREMEDRLDEIVSFSELERFIDVPLKHYSSGMQVRLGFAIATSIDPDVLLIDEVLAVGDEAFQHKCLDRISEFRTEDRTIVLVSHDLATVSELCDRAIWLEDGQVKGMGLTRRVVDMYLTSVGQKENEQLAAQHDRHMAEEAAQEIADGAGVGELPLAPSDAPTPQVAPPPEPQAQVEPEPPAQAEPAPEGEPSHWGTGDIQVTGIRLLHREGEETFVIQSGEALAIEVGYESRIEAEDVVFGVGIYRADGLFCYGTNTDLEKLTVRLGPGRGIVRVDFRRFGFIEGTYSLDVAIHTAQGMAYDYHRGYSTFAVRSRHGDLGVFRPLHSWRITPQGEHVCSMTSVDPSPDSSSQKPAS